MWLRAPGHIQLVRPGFTAEACLLYQLLRSLTMNGASPPPPPPPKGATPPPPPRPRGAPFPCNVRMDSISFMLWEPHQEDPAPDNTQAGQLCSVLLTICTSSLL